MMIVSVVTLFWNNPSIILQRPVLFNKGENRRGKGKEMANSQIAHSVPVICHLGAIMNHSATFLFSPWLNSTGRRGMFQNKVTTLTIIMCSNPYFVDIIYDYVHKPILCRHNHSLCNIILVYVT